MKIVLAAFADPVWSYETMPRGTFAYLHYLRSFGHDVLLLDRRMCVNPVRLIRAVRAFMPDVCLGQHLGAYWLAWFRRRGRLAAPVVHAWDDYYDEQSRFPRAWVARLEKSSVTGADHITSVSRWNVHRAQAWGRPATFVPHGVEPVVRESAIRLESDRFKIVYLGDQSLYKGMLRLMEAMRGVEADLFMVGTPNPALQARAPGNVRFVGRVPPEEVRAVLGQADLLVNPSDQDSNFKLVEYVAARRPILGVKGRMEWAFEHGKTAWLAEDLGEGIRRLAVDPACRRRLEEGVAALSVLTWEETVRRLEEVLFGLADPKAECVGYNGGQSR